MLINSAARFLLPTMNFFIVWGCEFNVASKLVLFMRCIEVENLCVNKFPQCLDILINIDSHILFFIFQLPYKTMISLFIIYAQY